jgi:Fusaric acid resistance protein-like
MRDLVQEAFRTEERRIDWPAAAAGSLAAIGPLAVGLAVDQLAAGLTAGIGGLNTALCVPRAPLATRSRWGALAAAGGAASAVLADLSAPHTWSVVLATLVWVGAWALLRAKGPTGALVGFATAAVFTILAGFPSAPPAGQRVLWFAMGALPALVLMACARRDSGRRSPPAAVSAGALGAHAARLAVAVAGGTLLYRAVDLPHGYWVPLTTLAILQPGEHATRVRALQRAVGTLGGAALILAVTLVTDNSWAIVACAGAAAFWLYALDERGYFWLVVMLTPTALLMMSVVDFEGESIVAERVANSAVGIVIGLAIGEAVRLPPHRWLSSPATPTSAARRRRSST